MTITQLINDVLTVLRNALGPASGAERQALQGHIAKIEQTRQALETNLRGRADRERGERQKIAQNHAHAVVFLTTHGPSLSNPEKRVQAAQYVTQLQAFPQTSIDRLADFLAKGLESEWLEKALVLLKGLAEWNGLSDADKARLEQVRNDAVNISVQAAVDDSDLDELRQFANQIGDVQSFLALTVAIDQQVDPVTGAQISQFCNTWQTDFLTPLTRGILSATTPAYEQLRSSFQAVNQELNRQLTALLQLVQSIQALNQFLEFFSKILTFALA